MADIFISYRREDAPGHAGRLYDRLRTHFGSDVVFMGDVDIPPGVDFVESLRHDLEAAEVMLVVIGRDWLAARDPRLQHRRLDGPDDFVRVEVAAALQRRIRVVPVLVDGARMPAAADLPSDLVALASRAAIELRNTDWESDVERLIRVIGGAQSRSRAHPREAVGDALRGVLSLPALLIGGVTVAAGALTRSVRKLRRQRREYQNRRRAESPPSTDPVLLGVSAPRRAAPGATFTARFVAYVKTHEEAVKTRLHQLDADPEGLNVQSVVGLSPDRGGRWVIGTPVTVRASGNQLRVKPDIQSFEWNGAENLVSFVIAVAETAPHGTTQLCFEVFIEGVPVAFIPLNVAIASASAPGDLVTATARPLSSAFASYASKDAPNVALLLSGLTRWDRGADIFMDCLDLTPNEHWRHELERVIPTKDVFLLFWSINASKSPWVAWELQHARSTKGLDWIRPMPIDDPDQAPPPEFLQQLHFRDRYLIARQAFLRLDERRSP
jgi:hypothetical protein